MTELSEVFLWRNQEIAADPKAGLVILGELSGTPANVSMYGLAPGPHRLLQVEIPEWDEHRVYYVNTRQADSLTSVPRDGSFRRKPNLSAGVSRPLNSLRSESRRAMAGRLALRCVSNC